jgi:hypothetical protein
MTKSARKRGGLDYIGISETADERAALALTPQPKKTEIGCPVTSLGSLAL